MMQTLHWTIRTVAGLLIAAGLLLPAAAHAQSAPMIGVLRGANTLIHFDAANPAAILTTVPITGLAEGDVVRGIDIRPATGVLYALVTPNQLTTQVRLYTVNPASGAATAVGPAVTVAVGGNFWGMSFNAVVDRVRIVNDFGANARLHPDTGALVAVDSPLSGTATPIVDSLAYDNQVAGATLTTLYALNTAGNQLARIGGVNGTPSANGGVVTNIGVLGTASLLGTAVSLDFAPSGTLYAAYGFQGAGYSLYTVNTVTGAATLVGLIGTGASAIDGIAVANAGLTISPGSGTYTAQQRFDMVLLLNAPGRTVVGGLAVFDGIDATGYIAGCVSLGQTGTGITTFRCPNLGGPLFGAGTHTFSVSLVLDTGASVSASTTWNVLRSTER
jgi:hypothetical protein